MYRLRGWDYAQSTTARPAIVGKFTLDPVYAELAPGVPERLKLEPKDKGRRKHHVHRWFTGDVGHPALEKHSFAANALLRTNANWGTFSMLLSRAISRRSGALRIFEPAGDSTCEDFISVPQSMGPSPSPAPDCSDPSTSARQARRGIPETRTTMSRHISLRAVTL